MRFTTCAVCHGAEGCAQAHMAQQFTAAGLVPPVGLAGGRTCGRSNSQSHRIVCNGLGGVPAFGDLLCQNDRWLVVRPVRRMQGQ